MIDYSPLWKTMKIKGVSQYRLLKSGIDNRTLDTLKNNRNITLLTLEKLCNILDCTPNDIVTFVNDISHGK
ncbi:XRE family transcriptional regulator [Absiella sp. AM54-8XD]|nr:XRE family transcriptional regulator [Absiella sp. AM09-45]RGB78527.1 XRE family transcriptional regulator [Absiella sp. AM09-50]RGC22485.1 XRE family transcriptional regulator [Absiella sp. AM54-8XD]RGC51888.1 XRE family transcriptional regulator [Absiella sp. AM29-15]